MNIPNSIKAAMALAFIYIVVLLVAYIVLSIATFIVCSIFGIVWHLPNILCFMLLAIVGYFVYNKILYR